MSQLNEILATIDLQSYNNLRVLFKEVLGSLEAEHEHFIQTVYRDAKIHSKPDCRYCILIKKGKKVA